MKPAKATVTVLKDGPYEIRGEVPLSRQIIVSDAKGGSVGWREGSSPPMAPPARSGTGCALPVRRVEQQGVLRGCHASIKLRDDR